MLRILPRLARLGACCVLLAGAAVLAAPPAPPAPKVWNVEVRYGIFAFGSLRIQQYREMLSAFKAAGFERSPDEEVPDDEADNPRYSRMRGTVPAAGVKRLLAQRHVKSLLITPGGVKLPEKGKRVRVDLLLPSGHLPQAQRDLHRETAALLAKGAGLVEAVLYDHRGFTRLLGSVPAEKVERLPDFVFLDLRVPAAERGESQEDLARRALDDLAGMIGFSEAAGYSRRGFTRLLGTVPIDNQGFVGVDLPLPRAQEKEAQQKQASRAANGLARAVGFVESPDYDRRGYTRLVGKVPLGNLGPFLAYVGPVLDRRMPTLTRTRQFVQLVEARPDLPVPSGMPPLPSIKPGQEKYDPALRDLLADAARAGARARLEVILGYLPGPRDRDWIGPLERTGVVVEGRMGPLVSVAGVPRDVCGKLAALDSVVAVRLPRLARHAPPGPRGEVPARWQPVRAAGLARLHALGLRGRGTRIAVISDDFKGWQTLKGRKEGKGRLPDPVMLDLTAQRNSDLVPDPYPSADRDTALGHGTRCAQALLRAAPEAELTLLRVDAAAPYMLETVARAINGDRSRTLALAARFREVRADRRAMEERKDDLLLERKRAMDDFRRDDEAVKRRKAYLARQAAYEADDEALRQRERRLLKMVEDMRQLEGVRIVACGLVWVDGHPVDGSSALSRYFDDRPFRSALWFQSAGDTRGQAWTGLFHDRDANGILEFADPRGKLPAGAWTTELNFLSWQPAEEKATVLLPAGTRLRLSLQWREAHDPLPLRIGEDVYREPLARFRLGLVRQFDPEGKTRPADDLEVVAVTAGPPQRLNQTLNSATYEYVLELSVLEAGRYGVYVEGRLPRSTQAPGEAQLPATRKVGEVWPRLFVNTLQGAGRAVWADFVSTTAALGMPADARHVVTVGAAGANDRPRPATPTGPPYNLALLKKPDVLAYDEGGGTSEATCFAAGLVASSWGSRGTLLGALERLGVRPGGVLRVPQRRR